MTCLKIPRRHLIYSLLGFFLFSLFFFCSSSSVFASNTFEYTWTDSSSSVNVSPPSGHVPDNTYCGYKYFYVSSSNTLRNNILYYTVNGNSTNLSLPSAGSFNAYSLYSAFTFSSSSVITNCRIQSYHSSLPFYVLLSDEPLNIGIVSDPPSGSITLTQNGTFDVSSYSEAVVDVPAVPGDYHDDLTSINNSILIVAAVALVLYFFYCIYRMIMRSTERGSV